MTEQIQRDDRRRGARTKPRAESKLWKLAAERLGLSAEDAQRVGLNRATRWNAGRLAN
jgi:hypothetical protein